MDNFENQDYNIANTESKYLDSQILKFLTKSYEKQINFATYQEKQKLTLYAEYILSLFPTFIRKIKIKDILDNNLKLSDKEKNLILLQLRNLLNLSSYKLIQDKIPNIASMNSLNKPKIKILSTEDDSCYSIKTIDSNEIINNEI
ncbi:uncharacterized protein CMU_042420 [Cryptosporidium muris RN66]|uniref:Uncharacterized protein n=1 Tax=Cryptosporidium muris (strain RN66) TaxID=441375 RepID=B6AAC8_CRYMR|nr:uncharacterized protein CMU_042420 [Cryptosporidium muris RN66]EEA05169.1 hypothetical protein CMU_042420 [Cryptosporidium muris RN66]|eukprot:XP_002139518.1 hypothetical protein [Cryptosporidium muris RN66]